MQMNLTYLVPVVMDRGEKFIMYRSAASYFDAVVILHETLNHIHSVDYSQLEIAEGESMVINVLERRKELRNQLKQLYRSQSSSLNNAFLRQKFASEIERVREELKKIEGSRPGEVYEIVSEAKPAKRTNPAYIHFCLGCGRGMLAGQQVVKYGEGRCCNYKCLSIYLVGKGQ